jgi:hypothetical protein
MISLEEEFDGTREEIMIRGRGAMQKKLTGNYPNEDDSEDTRAVSIVALKLTRPHGGMDDVHSRR